MKKYSSIILVALLVSCAGTQRDCANCNAGNFGANWLVVQYKIDGTPINCWTLENVAMKDEAGGGIYWQSEDGHLVHIGGHYNRVQVEHSRWDSAARAVGIDLTKCVDGAYGK